MRLRAALFLLGLPALAGAAGGPRVLTAEQLPWQTDPKTGVVRANLLGARDQAGPFVQRVRLPPDFHPGAHTHDGDLNASILRGEIHFRIGDGPVQRLRAGGYLFVPAGVPHEEWSGPEGAEFEARGTGPQTTVPLPASKP